MNKVMVSAKVNPFRSTARQWWVWLFLVGAFWLLGAGSLLAANFYTNYTSATVPWTNGIVPYEFTNTLTAAQVNTYLAGLREWELAANVKFVPHTSETHWILFDYNTNYLDRVFPGTNPQVVTVSSLSRAQVGHEMGHSFGFNHENIRPDAASYIAILTNNIADEPDNIVYFIVDTTTFPYGNYDFESVMHLGWDFASTTPGVLATQQPKPPNFPRYQYRMGNYCLSPGDRAALAYLYGPPAVPLSSVVTNTADVGPGSLRAAIYYATDHPGTTVRFAIPPTDPGYSNGVFNIHLSGMLPPLVANGMVIDGSTQPGFANHPLIAVDASQIIPETFTSDTVLIYSSSNQIKNISFSGFDWNGLTLEFADATNNTIAGCWIGLDATGTNAAPNAYQGILFGPGAGHNLIGGTNALARNVISGNSQYAIFITDSNTTGNVVLGNYIGTSAGGNNALANGYSGVFIGNGSCRNLIGGTNSGARNVMSGNLQYGVFITDSNTTGNVVLGNYIGTDASGLNAVPNGLSGVIIGGGPANNVIGSTNSAGRNILSGNTEFGIYLTNTTGNVILGNYLGVNVTGTAAIANQKSGVALYGGTQNIIGGNVTGAGNVLSGNVNYGVDIRNPVATGNLVQGNLIGLDAGGTNGIANGFGGVLLDSGALSNTIGGTVAGARNIISGNTTAGVFLTGTSTSNNLIEGNYVGTDITGTNSIPNTLVGIYLPFGTPGNVIGGTVAGARNIISGNYYGVYLASPATAGNVIEGNYLGVSPDGTQAVGSAFAGVIIFGGANSNTIGGTVTGAGNVISGFFGYGVYISDVGTSGNLVRGNIIGADLTGTNALGNGYANVLLQLGATNNVIGGIGAGNVIAFSGGYGVVVYDPGTTNNSIQGNSIFANSYLGIDLNGDGVTFNHAGFLAGPNNLQNFPVITNAYGFAGSTIISGTLNSLANRAYAIDVYRNFSPDFSGYGQGQFFFGSVTVTADSSGNATFSLTNAAGNDAGQYFTATATAATGDTSEFSLAVVATNAPAPAASFAGPFLALTNGFAFALNLQTNFSYRIQAATNLAANPVVWTDLTNFTATNLIFNFTDHTATNFHQRFYRVVSP
jgi:parallel beta-helix repeat protein